MDWSDSTTQRTFRNEVVNYINENLPTYYKNSKPPTGLEAGDWQNFFVLGDDEQKKSAQTWMTVLQKKGWVAPHWPKEYGGAGLSPIDQFILHQEMAQHDAPTVGGQGVSMLGPTILIHGTEQQKKAFLQPTLSGEMLWAQGFSEPGAGSDLASLQARAEKNGDQYIINGQKLWTSRSHKSNWIFGLFRTDPEAPKHRGISFFVMDQNSPGLSVNPIIDMAWEHSTNETFYENVEVPQMQVIGPENRGWYVAMTLLDYERSNISGAVHTRKRIKELIHFLKSDSANYFVHAFKQFRNAITDRYIESEVLFNFSFRIVSLQANDIVPNYEASVSKIFNSELSQRLSNTGTKIFGLYGNLWEESTAPMDAYFTREYAHSVVRTIFGGANEIQRNIIATRGLGLPRG
jgi:alkylation response protein AidB-like acyl-CoA dehydrogenase